MKRAIHTILDELADRAAPAFADAGAGGVLAAVSGGADSTALALVLARLAATDRLPGPLTLAHVDHAQHAGSHVAAAGVAALAASLGIGHGARRLALAPGPHSEATLRAARYDALATMAHAVRARTVVTAHHADDQLETVLFRVLRGSGPAGLAGIPRRRPLRPGVCVVRPLLSVPRRTLRQLVDASGRAVFEDPSNLDLRFARNRIRHEVLPRLRRRHGAHLDATLRRTAAAAAELASALERGATALLAARARRITPWRVEVDTSELPARATPLLEEAVRHLLRDLHGGGGEPAWSTVQRIVELVRSPAGTRVHGPGQPLVESVRGGLLFVDPVRAGSPPTRDTPLVPGSGPLRFGTTEWHLELAHRHREPGHLERRAARRVCLDAARAPLPWSTRTRRAGDRFWPLGMPGPVDLRGFLRGRHVPRFDRDRIPLVVDAGGDVIWIPGVEVGHRARRRPETRAWIEARTETPDGIAGGVTASAEPY